MGAGHLYPGGGGEGGNQTQACSRLSTTHGHITDCKLDSVVYAGVICSSDDHLVSCDFSSPPSMLSVDHQSINIIRVCLINEDKREKLKWLQYSAIYNQSKGTGTLPFT